MIKYARPPFRRSSLQLVIFFMSFRLRIPCPSYKLTALRASEELQVYCVLVTFPPKKPLLANGFLYSHFCVGIRQF